MRRAKLTRCRFCKAVIPIKGGAHNCARKPPEAAGRIGVNAAARNSFGGFTLADPMTPGSDYTYATKKKRRPWPEINCNTTG